MDDRGVMGEGRAIKVCPGVSSLFCGALEPELASGAETGSGPWRFLASLIHAAIQIACIVRESPDEATSTRHISSDPPIPLQSFSLKLLDCFANTGH
jgi:hypothetical protein